MTIKKIKNFLYFLLENIKIPIISGKLKGKFWILGSRGKIFRYITTTYELPLVHLFYLTIKEGYVVYDIGAHAGYFTLLSSCIVGERGKVCSFEPNKEISKVLCKNIKINKCLNVVVFDKAVSDRNCLCFFKCGEGSGTGKISNEGEYLVEVVKLDDFILENNLPIPNVIKIDVEGEELNVLKGAKNILEKHHPILFLSCHSQKLYDECSEFLKSINYKIYTLETMKDLIIAKKKTTR